MTIELEDLPVEATDGKGLQHGLISGLWLSAYVAEAAYYVAASLFGGFIAIALFVFGQVALIFAILGTIVYVWTMPAWNATVMGWMWAGCLLAGLWLGMYYAPLAPVVWGMALVTTLRWIPAWRRAR